MLRKQLWAHGRRRGGSGGNDRLFFKDKFCVRESGGGAMKGVG